MAKFRYTPDPDQKVHKAGAIKLISSDFQSHEAGLPEWVKNSADEYVRRDTPAENRIIVLVFCDGAKGRQPSISCLDFGGMTSKVIDERFGWWADPEAARGGGDARGVQGGHGNGGKSYMTQMFDEYAVVHTVEGQFGNRYGVAARSFHFGYVPDPETGCDFRVEDLRAELTRVLSELGCTLDGLPREVEETLWSATGFTLVSGVGPKGYKRKILVKQLADSLVGHPQMVATLQACKVFVVSNGQMLNGGKPLNVAHIEPMPGWEEARVIPVPERVKAALPGKRVSTTQDGALPRGRLVLRTSKKSMRHKKRRARHTIAYVGQSGFIGYDAIPELDVRSTYCDYVYGECHLEALEPFKLNARGPLAKSHLTAGVRQFISYEVERLAEELERREQRKYSQKTKSAISRINEALDKWKNRFLGEMMGGVFGEGEPTERRLLPAGVPKRLELSLTHSRIGSGVSIKPIVRFFDKQGRRIRSVPYRFVSEDPNVAMADEDLNTITAFSYGSTVIYAETIDDGLRSNRFSLEVVRIHHIQIAPAEITVPRGSRSHFDALCTLADGTTATDVFLEWTEENSAVARASASGMVFGCDIGETAVHVNDDKISADKPGIVKVVEGKGGGAGKGKGRGFPKVLVSGEIDPDPDTDKFVQLSSDHPPIWQRPEDVERNIWWINSASPLAKLYLDRKREFGHETRAWRMYHVERYIDVIVQIALSRNPSEPEKSADEWILDWGSRVAEIQMAAADELADFIADGKLPEGES